MSDLIKIDFRGDTILASIGENGVPTVAIKPIVERLGVDWPNQLQRLKRDTTLSEGMVIITIPSPGGPQDMVALPINLLAGFLFGIDDSRVSQEARPMVLAYKRECHEVLYRHFFGAKTDAETLFADMDPTFRLALFREFRLAKTAEQKRLLVDMHPVLADYLDLPPPAPAASGASSVGLDYVRTFLSERTAEAPGGRVNSTVLFQAFEAWAKTQDNVPPMTHTAFALTLNRLGVRKANYEGRKFYLGIRIRHTLEIEGEG